MNKKENYHLLKCYHFIAEAIQKGESEVKICISKRKECIIRVIPENEIPRVSTRGYLLLQKGRRTQRQCQIAVACRKGYCAKSLQKGGVAAFSAAKALVFAVNDRSKNFFDSLRGKRRNTF